jgi:hypothetical protein
MDIFFKDPGEVPLPPEEVRIREFRAEPWPDGRRVHVTLEVDPFQKRPNAEVVILKSDDQVAAEITIVETLTRKMEFNMHLRLAEPAGDYRARVSLYYQPLNADSEGEAAEPAAPSERQVVDTGQSTFSIAS